MTRSRNRIPAILLALATLIAPPPAHARETLIALGECPNEGPHRACLPIEFRLAEQTPEKMFASHVDSAGRLTKDYLIKGRLSGGKARPFRLRVVYERSETDVTADGPDVLPYRGRGAANMPVVLTNRGPVEILTKQFYAARSPNLIVVDERRWAVVARYLSYEAYASYLVKSPVGIDVWIKRNGVCISAVGDKLGLLATNKRACSASNALDGPLIVTEAHPNFERLVKLPELRWFDLDDISDDGSMLQSSGGLSARVYRFLGSSYLLVYTWCDDCF